MRRTGLPQDIADAIDRGAFCQNKQIIDDFTVNYYAWNIADDYFGPPVRRSFESVFLCRA